MIADIQAVQESLECDLCIIGAGAAGIAIAREFLSSPYRVILLESGGFRRDERVQQLYSGESIGERYFELHECRSRYFGGSTNCWAGICTPLNEIDFVKRSWVPWSGWPFGLSELAPHLRKAHDICGAGPFVYDHRAWELIGIPAGGFSADRFERFVWHFNGRDQARIKFGTRFRNELRQAQNVDVFLNATVRELVTDQSGRSVEAAKVVTLAGQTRYIRARKFVLACGGIENARVLLSSDGYSPTGLGNQRDLVGRFFQEHLQAPCATLVVPDRGSVASCYSQLFRFGGSFCLPGLTLAPKAQEVHQTLNGSIAVDPFYDEDGALMALQNLRRELKGRRVNRRMFNQMWRLAWKSRDLVPEAWRRLAHGDRPRGDPHRFVIYARAEQAPNPDSRIGLSRKLDELGMRRVSMDWRTIPLDRKAIRLMAVFAAEEFTRLGMGRVIPAEWLSGEEWPETFVGGPHHMGTTRMSDEDSTGVVDRNCKVHGLQGLYIAGSSVFPTGGHANPTLTILALALRLGAHLRASLSSSASRLTRESTQAAGSPKAEQVVRAVQTGPVGEESLQQ